MSGGLKNSIENGVLGLFFFIKNLRCSGDDMGNRKATKEHELSSNTNKKLNRHRDRHASSDRHPVPGIQ
jgi:hypothetical protein